MTIFDTKNALLKVCRENPSAIENMNILLSEFWKAECLQRNYIFHHGILKDLTQVETVLRVFREIKHSSDFVDIELNLPLLIK